MEINNKKKRKKILNIVLGGGSIIAMLGIIIYIQVSLGINGEQFHKKKHTSIIVKKEKNWLTGRSNAFYLSDGLKIFLAFNKEGQLSVGDSLYKETNTYIYDVYRKNEYGQYEHRGTYNFNEVY